MAAVPRHQWLPQPRTGAAAAAAGGSGRGVDGARYQQPRTMRRRDSRGERAAAAATAAAAEAGEGPLVDQFFAERRARRRVCLGVLGFFMIVDLTYILYRLVAFGKLQLLGLVFFIGSGAYYMALVKRNSELRLIQQQRLQLTVVRRRRERVLGEAARARVMTVFVYGEEEQGKNEGEGKDGEGQPIPVVDSVPVEEEEGGDNSSSSMEQGRSATTTASAASTDANAALPPSTKDHEEPLTPGGASVKTTPGAEEWTTTETCIICFDDYELGSELCRLPCLHVFHKSCCDEWLNGAGHTSCPFCKYELWDEDQDEDEEGGGGGGGGGGVGEGETDAAGAGAGAGAGEQQGGAAEVERVAQSV